MHSPKKYLPFLLVAVVAMVVENKFGLVTKVRAKLGI